MRHSKPTFDLYATADLLVDDVDASVERLVDVLGLPQPEDRWRHDFPDSGYRAVFCRVQRSITAAPTVIEVIAPEPVVGASLRDAPRTGEFLEAQRQRQGRRRPATHATVVSVADLEDFAERLDSRGVPYRMEHPTSELPFARLWVGRSDDDPTDYDPKYDAGLFVEVVPLSATGAAQRVGAATSPRSAPLPGALDRVLARGFVVDDLSRTLEIWRGSFGWEPAAVDHLREEGFRRAVFTSGLERGAAFELLEPVDPDSRLGQFHSRHGPGPHHIRIGVHQLATKAAELGDRRISFSWIDHPSPLLGPRIEIAPRELDGAVVELSEVS